MEGNFSAPAVFAQALAKVSDGLRPGLEFLSSIGWDAGLWTLITPIILPLIYLIVMKLSRNYTSGWRFVHLAAIGLLLGGVVEHIGPYAYVWFAGAGF